MHALLRLSLMVSTVYLCWHLVTFARHGNLQKLRLVTRQLRGFAILNGGLLLAWLVMLVRR
jgi:hypothetical protein